MGGPGFELAPKSPRLKAQQPSSRWAEAQIAERQCNRQSIRQDAKPVPAGKGGVEDHKQRSDPCKQVARDRNAPEVDLAAAVGEPVTDPNGTGHHRRAGKANRLNLRNESLDQGNRDRTRNRGHAQGQSQHPPPTPGCFKGGPNLPDNQRIEENPQSTEPNELVGENLPDRPTQDLCRNKQKGLASQGQGCEKRATDNCNRQLDAGARRPQPSWPSDPS